MNPSEELRAMSIANSPEPQVSEEGQAAAGRIAAARAKADNTITPESLAPQAEVQVTNPQTGTAMAGLGGALEAQTDSFAQGLAETRKQREAEKNQSRNDYSSLVANRTGLEGFSLQADQDAGVFEADSALQDINNELRTEQLARRRSNELITSTGGQSKGQAQSQINNVNRDSYSKQADMAIVQLAAQGRFNSASALADRKANAMFEQEQNKIDAAKITYEDNKDLYNKAEQREFETALTDRTNRVQAEKEQMQAVQNLALQAQLDGAPPAIVSEMMKSKTLADASALGGQFVGALNREQQRASIAQSKSSMAANYASIDLAERKFNYAQQQDKLDAELKAMVESGAISVEDAAKQGKVESALRLMDLSSQIRGHAGFNLSVGSVGSRIVGLEGGIVGQLFNYLSGQGEGFDGLYDQLTESLTLDNLDKMSGVLTDRDIQVLRDAGTRLRKTTTEAEFLAVLDEMDSIFQRTIDETGITPEQARFYFGADEETMMEVDNIWGDTAQSTVNSLDNDTF